MSCPAGSFELTTPDLRQARTKLVGISVPSSIRPLIGSTLTRATFPVRSTRLRRQLAKAHKPVKINVGAGPTRLNGWINTDVTFRAPHHLNLTRPWPVADGEVDFIYADNVIEHFPLSLGRDVLRHAWSALATGGILRLVTPDVGRTARAYLDDPELTQRHMDRHRSAGYQIDHAVDVLRVIFIESGHHTGYLFDEEALTEELHIAGFPVVRRCELGESGSPELRGLEQRSDESSSQLSLVLEAEKR
jgi:predicted SAM-dependent methyltransferase